VTREAASGNGRLSGTKICAAVLERRSEDIMFKKPINRALWEPELASKISHMRFKKNSQIDIWLFLCRFE
jgi:hypothetical protein